jgi:hypothetical protein
MTVSVCLSNVLTFTKADIYKNRVLTRILCRGYGGARESILAAV